MDTPGAARLGSGRAATCGCAPRRSSGRRPLGGDGRRPEWGCPPAHWRPARPQQPGRRAQRAAVQLHAAAQESSKEGSKEGSKESSSYREQLVGLQRESQQRLERLREVRLRNETRLKGSSPGPSGSGQPPQGQQQEGSSPAKLVSTPKAVDRRVYDQVAASRNRLSKQLSEKNRYIRHLEARLEERMQVVTTAHAAVVRVGNELEAIKRMAEVAIAAAAYGVDKADAVARSERIMKRAETLKQGILDEAGVLDALVVRRVPIMWYGVASEVKLMGSFDGWTEGYSLSPNDIQDQTFTRFRADVPLLPGSYIVKFQVDTVHWRLAPDWPTVDAADGSTNNVLVVE